MGIYIFTWPVLREFLMRDDRNQASQHDFGKNIIPAMLQDGRRMFAYRFDGYWKDVGTVQSLWEANMDLIKDEPELNLGDKDWRIYSRSAIMPAHYMGRHGSAVRSIVTEGCDVDGAIRHSVLFAGVTIGEGAEVSDSVVLPGARIGRKCGGEKSHRGRERHCACGRCCRRAPCGERPAVRYIAHGGYYARCKQHIHPPGCARAAGMIVNADTFGGKEG